MGNRNQDNQLRAQRTARPLLAMTLAASLAAFGCTTNHNLGNGTPTRSGPDVRTAPTAGVTSGGETDTPPSNPPMTSSYTKSEMLPATVTVKRNGVIRRSPDEAAAIMAGRQALRGRYLGVVSPGTSGRGYASSTIQTYVNPAMQTNPQLTVNSSISSDPNGVVSSGAEGLFDAGSVTTGTTAAATVGATTTTAGLTPTPTQAVGNLPSVTAASVGLGRTTTQRATVATTTTTAASTAPAVRSGTVVSPVRVMRGTTGNVTVTNTRNQ
ncbi:MAG TPA: hypothetical protein VGD79_04975 [Thermoanaerobaculia bacterium]|jgi:hypothetical protein